MVNRMTGLSGLDTETLVKQMMLRSQTKYDNLYKKKVEAEWKKTLYNDIYTQLKELDTKLFDYSLSSKTMTKSTSISNDAIATVSASANASNASHTLLVKQLASGVSAASSDKISTSTSITTSHSTKNINATDDLATQLGLGGDTSFVLNGKTINVSSTDKIDDLVNKINAERGTTGVEAKYDAATGNFHLRAEGPNAKIEMLAVTTDSDSLKLVGNMSTPVSNKNSLATQFDIAPNTNMTFKINGKEISMNSSDSISTLVSKINSSGAGVSASYDSNMDRLFINTTSTGEAAQIGFTTTDATTETFLNKLKLVSSEKYETGVDAGKNKPLNVGDVAKGKDAIFELDGIEFNQSTNDFSISGITYSLKSTSDSPALVTVKTDNKAILENVKSLVETYNKLLETLNGKTKEKYYRDFPPLTEEQRKEMTEKEIELWEEKAKSGLLRNDSLLKGLASKMRTAMYGVSNSVNGDYNSLSKLGISTTDYSDEGKLTINEDKFLEALEKDPGAVSKLFSAEDSFIGNLRTSIQSTMKNLETKSGAGKTVDSNSTLYKQIYDWGNELDTMSKKMVQEENRYYTMFSRMETALNKLNSQNNYLTSMLGQ